MSDDPMEWLRNESNFARHLTGREQSNEEFATQFLKLKPVDRSQVLASLDAKLADAHLTLEAAQKFHARRSKLISAHQIALRVKR
jgi:hypothetical protein